MKLSQLASFLNLCYDDASEIQGFSMDTRQLRANEVFVALQGENLDGNQFLAQAQEKAALAVLCQKSDPSLRIPQFVVPDSAEALAMVAKKYRHTMPCKVIALTGSNGKTTVKEMIATALPPPALSTKGNFNNHLGLPLSVLRLRPEHRYAVFELGANHPGEIAFTAAICKPDIALINNIGPAHLEGFGSVEGVANAKGEIYQSLPQDGIAIINEDDRFAHHWDALLQGKKILRFSRYQASDIYATDIQMDSQHRPHFRLLFPNGKSLPIDLPIPGEHMISNALAAASCLYAAGIPVENIQQGLQQFRGVPGRQTLYRGPSQSCLIDDSYNANLGSVKSAIEVLAACQGKRTLVLADMGELGSQAKEYHSQAGVLAKEAGIDQLFCVGQLSQAACESFGSGSRHFANKEALVHYLKEHLTQEDTVLFKGSRKAALEEVVRPLLTETTKE